MTGTGVRERPVWVALVAVLTTSMAWLAVINLALVMRGHSVELHPAFVVARTLLKAMLLVVRQGWSVVFASVLGWSLVGVLASVMLQGRTLGEGVRHA